MKQKLETKKDAGENVNLNKHNIADDFEYKADMIIPKSMTKEYQDKLKVVISLLVEFIQESGSVLFLETNKIEKGE